MVHPQTTREKIDYLAMSAKSIILTGREIERLGAEILSTNAMSDSDLTDMLLAIREKHGEIVWQGDDYESMSRYDLQVAALQNEVIASLRGVLGMEQN